VASELSEALVSRSDPDRRSSIVTRSSLGMFHFCNTQRTGDAFSFIAVCFRSDGTVGYVAIYSDQLKDEDRQI
jgi:hypothetical protein